MLKLTNCSRISPDDVSLPPGLALPRLKRSASRKEVAAAFRIAAAILRRDGSIMLSACMLNAGPATFESGRALDKYAALLEAIDRQARGGRLVHVRRGGGMVASDAINKLRKFASFVRWTRSVVSGYVLAIKRERALWALLCTGSSRDTRRRARALILSSIASRHFPTRGGT